MSYHLARLLIRIVVRLTARVEVIHYERTNLPEGFIVVSNHLGRLDVAFVYFFLNRKEVTVLVAEKYKQSAFFRWAVKALDAVWIDRFNADLVAMRECLQRLKKGHILVMAPEGTRSASGALIEARSGASYLAAKSGAWILPVAATGTEDHLVIKNLRRLKRSRVVIHVGEPFKLPPLPRENRESALQQYTDEMMCRIAALLPPAYRGYYADHSRLKELIAETSQVT
jgi:1-acyl-sn-glycerol-3-phosphate acyltransferase